MEKISRMHLFQGYGIELEYMIVDKDTLDVKPIADELLKLKAGEYVDEIENGSISWSNELVLHVIELKCTVPTKNLWQLNADFAANIKEINQLLDRFNAKLMPTAAHPWMNPENDTFLWPHGNSEVYETYNQIFNCKGHGWSNLQSTHINLPFYDDEEFAALHMAVRLILPIIPGIAASSPILDGNFTGFHDKRMVYYGENQKRIPSITGKIIPERVNSKRQYHKLIYEPIKANIEPYNANNQLKPVWVNSRGAIARFDRGSLEIRIMDIQECPLADLAIVTLII
ncbi:MAG: glutamate-cysteine ligase family protein, partial [Cyclobacteriaceae bacterium]|nr:glutamate-cysteine ligase family protein [Cyclobacteriaceae bacterium]